MDRTAIGNRQQPRTLFIVKCAVELDVPFDESECRLTRVAVGTIVSVNPGMTEANRHTLQRPLLAPCVHRDGHRRARPKSSKQQVVQASDRYLSRPLKSVHR